MCGIAGIFNYADPAAPVDRRLLERMTRLLEHRGPDDEGLHVDGGLGFGNRRLAIVDVRQTGHQPMTDESSSCWLTYNGEFYNHREFRPRLIAKGARFRGTSDTETLLHLLKDQGPGALASVAGIFALAFWDPAHRRLILARDPLGVKQLYYHDDGSRILFASEIKALLACEDIPREFDPEAVNEYLHFHTPLFDRTFFKNVRQVRQGEYLDVGHFGVHCRRYWTLDGFDPRQETPAESVDELRHLLETVVGEQLMGDVPAGCFFSGGIDSTAVAAFANRNGVTPRCFGVHFVNQGVIDEGPYQRIAAKALGVPLELTTVDEASFADDLLRLTYYQDQPVVGAALIPMYHVSRLAARHVKVCLGGQAADELFGGYARYALAEPAKSAATLLSRYARLGRGSRAGGNLLKQLASPRTLARLARRLRPGESWTSRYFENFAQVGERTWRSLFADPQMVSRQHARDLFEETVARSPAVRPADKALHWDMQTYLPGLFHQDDRMSMANSLESRVPLADPRIVRFAWHTSFDLKVRSGASKWILREAVADLIPDEVLNRRKVGFDTPAEAWMRGSQREFVRDLLLSSRARTRGLWNVSGVEQLLDSQSPGWFPTIWKVLSIEAWASVFLDRVALSVAAEEPCEPYAIARS
jgi:asparagine synthase (glutamine-hydrolysing)